MEIERTLNKEDIAKQEILEAAKRVFQKWGLNKTTMEDIAHEAGKGKSTLYYYFKSKDEIFELLVKAEFNNIINKGKDFISQINSSKEKLKKYISTTLNEIKNTVSLFSLVRGEIKGNKESLEKLRNYLDSEEELIIKEILKGGLSSKEFNFLEEKDLTKAANVIVGVIRGLQTYLFLDNDDNEKIDIVTRMISEGI
jgi:AcrR family transcriptional regulator